MHRALWDESFDVQAAAKEELIRLADRAVPQLLKSLGDRVVNIPVVLEAAFVQRLADLRDLGSAMSEIRRLISGDPSLAVASMEYGGLYQQQEESFHALLIVLGLAVALVVTVALLSVFGIIIALHRSWLRRVMLPGY